MKLSLKQLKKIVLSKNMEELATMIVVVSLFNYMILPKLDDKTVNVLTENTMRIGFGLLIVVLMMINVYAGFGALIMYLLVVKRSGVVQKQEVVAELKNTIAVIEEAEKARNTPSPNDNVEEKSVQNGEFKIEKEENEKEENEEIKKETLGLVERDNSALLVSNSELKKQNKGLVSEEQLETQYAISLKEDLMKHNSNSYKVNDNTFVIGELLMEGSAVSNSEPMMFNELNNAIEVENVKKVDVVVPTFEPFENPSNVFTSVAQFKDVQTNEVECCAPKKPVAVKCFSDEGIRSAKEQYSAQGMSDQPHFPVGYSA